MTIIEGLVTRVRAAATYRKLGARHPDADSPDSCLKYPTLVGIAPRDAYRLAGTRSLLRDRNPQHDTCLHSAGALALWTPDIATGRQQT